ncbi:MAG TPA: peptidoglycan-binding domain-containing protein [Solirubrobacteraceae bacterium]|nr:peptidoglycan-binding domain-containing protein [Solirubrobacteraceae bacterium]
MTIAAAFAGAASAFASGGGGASLGGHTKHQRHQRHQRHHARSRHRHHRAHHHGSNPLHGRGVWIWELGSTAHGNLATILARAHRYGISTVFMKSSDGGGFWSGQFSSAVVHALQRGGLKVCAWQYVYGYKPVAEANAGAEAVRHGANCLVIDAEAQYEGRYVAAQTYIERLRSLIGPRYPLALASFPYVDYHPSFPYSVFLGPGGAQFNVPQMYWKDIGTSVSYVYAHTYAFNRPYRRRIYPLGQIYSDPPSAQIEHFRAISRAYGATGVSWWDWQSARQAAWRAISRPVGRLPGFAPYQALATVGRGARGDLVVWIQEHLVSAGYAVKVSGKFKARTVADVMAFQRAHGLGVDGIVGSQTWAALLRYRPAHVDWTNARRLATAARMRTAAAGARAGRTPTVTLPVPLSAGAPARRDEIPGALGAGRPR